MLVLRDQIERMPIMSLQTGSQIAHIEGAIIDPRRLYIMGFYCAGPGVDTHPAILHTSDIRETGSMGLIVDGADSIMGPDDLVRLREVTDMKFELINKPVIDDTGRKIGKVINFTVDTDSFLITKLHVQPGFLHALATAEVIIARQQITQVTNKRIVVKAPTIKATESTKMQAVAVNPFRHATRPQPDSIEPGAQASH